MSVSQRAAALAPRLNKIIDDFVESDANSNDHIQAVGYQLRKLIVDADLGTRERVPPGHCGISPGNRGGEMLVPIAMWELLTIVACKKGWDPSKLVGALCEELPPAGKERDFVVQQNVSLHSKSKHLLAPLEVELMRVLTSASSHMTAALRLVNYAGVAPVIPPDLGPAYDITPLLDNGKLSKQRVIQCCPGIEEYLEQGIEYLKIRYQLVALCPQLMSVLSEADNASHDTYRQETWLQQLLSIHARARQVDACTDDDWNKIAQQLGMGKV